MQLNSKLSLVLCAILAAQPIAATPTPSDNDAAELSPRSGVNNGVDLGDILGGAGLFGGDNKGNYGNNHGNGGRGGIGYDNGAGKGHGGKHKFAAKKLKAAKAAKHANKHAAAAKISTATNVDAAAARVDANHNKADLVKFKKAKAKGFGKGGFDDFGGFDRRDGGVGSGAGIGFGGQNYGAGRGGFDYGSGRKGFSGGSHKKEKVEKLAKHLENANKHKAAAKINKDAKFKAAAAHEDAHLDKAAAKKLAAEKKKSGFGNFF
ncbi:hypothetical protein A4X13_0g9228 [Tilletia indica]|uniref:Uncharacterized protein n=1 Tax=Tilletia indica TaxID=43049 RepID=A0A8T8SAP0_9BASI|nr:hypothetical protein A4X13_0g9228 [Tilletia indica]